MIKLLLTLVSIGIAIFVAGLIQSFGCEHPAITGAVLVGLFWFAIGGALNVDQREGAVRLAIGVISVALSILASLLLLSWGCTFDTIAVVVVAVILLPFIGAALGVHKKAR